MKILAGRRRDKSRSIPQLTSNTSSKQKGHFAGRGGPIVSRRIIPRHDHDGEKYNTDTRNCNYFCEDRTYYTYDSEDTFCKQGSYHCRPPRHGWQGYYSGFCTDDSRDEVESEITDNACHGSNYLASCLCCEQEFGFKLALTKVENEKGTDHSLPSLVDLGLIDDLAVETYREMEILRADSLESDLPRPETARTTLHGAKDQIQPGVEMIQHDALRMGAALERGLHRMVLASPWKTAEEPTLLPEQLNGGGEKFDSSFQDDCGLDKIARNHRIYGVEVSDKGIAGGVTLHFEKDGHEEDDLSMTAGVEDVEKSDEEEELNIKSGCVNLCLTPRRQDDLEEDAIALHAPRAGDNTNVIENNTKANDAIECAAAEIRDSTSSIDPQIEEADTGTGASTESTDTINLVASKDADSVADKNVDEMDPGDGVPTESSGALALSCEKDGHEPDSITGAGVSTESPIAALDLVASKDADSVAVQRDDGMDPGEGVPTESSGAPILPCEKDCHEPDDPTMISDLDDQDCTCTQQEVNAKAVFVDPCQKRKQDNHEEQQNALQVFEEGVIDSQASF